MNPGTATNSPRSSRDQPVSEERSPGRDLLRPYAAPRLTSVTMTASAVFLAPTPMGTCCDTGAPPPCVFPDVPNC